MAVQTKISIGAGCRFLGVILIAGLVGFACAAPPRSPEKSAPMSLEELFRMCVVPGTCVSAPEWNGRPVIFDGYVDPANIFIKQRYPQLPYEKFRVLDRHGRSIEVWLQAGDNRAIGQKLAGRPSDHVVIQGWLEAINLRIASRCVQGVKVWINETEQIQFQTR